MIAARDERRGTGAGSSREASVEPQETGAIPAPDELVPRDEEEVLPIGRPAQFDQALVAHLSRQDVAARPTLTLSRSDPDFVGVQAVCAWIVILPARCVGDPLAGRK